MNLKNSKHKNSEIYVNFKKKFHRRLKSSDMFDANSKDFTPAVFLMGFLSMC